MPRTRCQCADRAVAPYGHRRVSRARAAIADAASAFRGAFTAEDLHARVASARTGIGLATVYRALAAMVEAGTLTRVGERDGAALYAACSSGWHHHHAVCERCGAVEPIACAFVSGSMPSGFTATRHEVAVYGVCAACAHETGDGR